MGFGIPWQSQGSGVFQEVGVMIAIFANGKTGAHKVKIIWQSCIYMINRKATLNSPERYKTKKQGWSNRLHWKLALATH